MVALTKLPQKVSKIILGWGIWPRYKLNPPAIKLTFIGILHVHALVGNDLSYCSLKESCYEPQSSVWIRAVKHYFLINKQWRTCEQWEHFRLWLNFEPNFLLSINTIVTESCHSNRLCFVLQTTDFISFSELCIAVLGNKVQVWKNIRTLKVIY